MAVGTRRLLPARDGNRGRNLEHTPSEVGVQRSEGHAAAEGHQVGRGDREDRNEGKRHTVGIETKRHTVRFVAGTERIARASDIPVLCGSWWGRLATK